MVLISQILRVLLVMALGALPTGAQTMCTSNADCGASSFCSVYTTTYVCQDCSMCTPLNAFGGGCPSKCHCTDHSPCAQFNAYCSTSGTCASCSSCTPTLSFNGICPSQCSCRNSTSCAPDSFCGITATTTASALNATCLPCEHCADNIEISGACPRWCDAYYECSSSLKCGNDRWCNTAHECMQCGSSWCPSPWQGDPAVDLSFPPLGGMLQCLTECCGIHQSPLIPSQYTFVPCTLSGLTPSSHVGVNESIFTFLYEFIANVSDVPANYDHLISCKVTTTSYATAETTSVVPNSTGSLVYHLLCGPYDTELSPGSGSGVSPCSSTGVSGIRIVVLSTYNRSGYSEVFSDNFPVCPSGGDSSTGGSNVSTVFILVGIGIALAVLLTFLLAYSVYYYRFRNANKNCTNRARHFYLFSRRRPGPGHHHSSTSGSSPPVPDDVQSATQPNREPAISGIPLEVNNTDDSFHGVVLAETVLRNEV